MKHRFSSRTSPWSRRRKFTSTSDSVRRTNQAEVGAQHAGQGAKRTQEVRHGANAPCLAQLEAGLSGVIAVTGEHQRRTSAAVPHQRLAKMLREIRADTVQS